MLVRFLAILLLPFVNLTIAGPVTDLDTSQAVRDMNLGADLQSLTGLKKIGSKGDTETFSATLKKAEFAGFPVRNVICRFKSKKLYEIEFWLFTCPALYRKLQAELGKDLKLIKGRDEFEWRGSNIVFNYKGYCSPSEGIAARLRIRQKDE
ncbi:MAG: hypothetical protein QF473_37340 [Planctomycetota bacterium]|jgi:hypothetical protein|nr:hypothetical protein [Planctomycetota bacterium]